MVMEVVRLILMSFVRKYISYFLKILYINSNNRFIALTKRGDEKYTKFGKLIEKLGASPMGMLEQQAKARHFKTRFVLVEEREATATTPPLVVVEVII